MSNRKSTSSSKSLFINDGPWGFSCEGEVSLDPLPRGIFNGKMVGASVEVAFLLFYACFERGTFVLTVVKSSRTT